ncbi:MAG: desulfoferrodoxin [Desulfovibrio sp.]|jgi:superoxide reductase|nr:desulfoferrodoxin [Desulfovibrio sp.]
MTSCPEIYKCAQCGNIVEVRHGGDAELVCCGAPMTLMVEGAVDAAKEKHVPVIERIQGGFKVAVGAVTHPMEDKHHIEWIQLLADDRNYVRMLKPGLPPEATFSIEARAVTARAFCNLHGLWKAQA